MHSAIISLPTGCPYGTKSILLMNLPLMHKPKDEKHGSHHLKDPGSDADIMQLGRIATDVSQLQIASSITQNPWLVGALWLSSLGLAFVAGRVLVPGGSGEGSPVVIDKKDTSPSTQHASVFVTSEPITIRALQRTVSAVGTLHGFEEVAVSSKVEGRVVRIHHDLSNFVRPGELLLELDATDAKLTVDQSERSVQTELARWGFDSVPSPTEDLSRLPPVVSARLRFELATSRLNRMLRLRVTNAISEEDLEHAQSEAQVLDSEWNNQLLQAKSAAAVARLRSAELAVAKQRLLDCEIRVPVPTIVDSATDPVYTISERMVSEGAFVRVGAELFRLFLGSSLKLKLAIPEIHAKLVKVGQSVVVTTDAAAEPVTGKVAKVSPAIDRSTRTFAVEVEITNEHQQLKPGSFARANIVVGHQENAITIPLSGLYSLAGINKIFLIDSGRAQEHKVELGDQTSEWVEVLSNSIDPKLQVVTSGQRMLSQGIAVVERAPTASATQAGGSKAADATETVEAR